MADFHGRVAVVTGANSGIGRATASLFAGMGASVVLAARRKDELAEATAHIVQDGGTAAYLPTDVAVGGQVERLVAFAQETFGRLDIFANVAGTPGGIGPLVEMSEEGWDEAIDVNLKGAFHAIKFAARAMIAAGHGGAIVNVGSINGFRGSAGVAPYCAAKHGLMGLNSTASAELAQHGIRVNVVCPGIIDTPMHRLGRKVLGDALYDDVIIPKIHQRRAGTPEETAKAIAFLCSADASFITGTSLTVDGGGAWTF